MNSPFELWLGVGYCYLIALRMLYLQWRFVWEGTWSLFTHLIARDLKNQEQQGNEKDRNIPSSSILLVWSYVRIRHERAFFLRMNYSWRELGLIDVYFQSQQRRIDCSLEVLQVFQSSFISSDKKRQASVRRMYVGEVRMSTPTQSENAMEYKVHAFHSHYSGSRRSEIQLAMEP